VSTRRLAAVNDDARQLVTTRVVTRRLALPLAVIVLDNVTVEFRQSFHCNVKTEKIAK
jgi:hypothetical protein